MIIGSAAADIGVAVVGFAVFAVLVIFFKSCLKVVQQGSVGVVKRFGEFRNVRQPGLHVLLPLADRMDKVDIREFPRTGDQQAVITQDNVSLWVSATIFCQVTDVKLALFEVNDFGLAIDQMARTALRAVFGELTLDQALSERDTINTRMQEHMAEATLKWGVRLNRIEILDITPPNNVLQAMSEQKEAEQHKRAAILKSEGEQQSAINTAQGRKQSAILEAEGRKQSEILAAEGQKQAIELRAEAEKRATQLRGEGEAGAARGDRRGADQAEHSCGDAAPCAPGGRDRCRIRRSSFPTKRPAWSGAAQALVDAVKVAGVPDDSDVAGNGRAATPSSRAPDRGLTRPDRRSASRNGVLPAGGRGRGPRYSRTSPRVTEPAVGRWCGPARCGLPRAGRARAGSRPSEQCVDLAEAAGEAERTCGSPVRPGNR